MRIPQVSLLKSRVWGFVFSTSQCDEAWIPDVHISHTAHVFALGQHREVEIRSATEGKCRERGGLMTVLRI